MARSAPTEHKRALMSRQGDTLTSQGHFLTEGPDRKNSSPPLGILVAKNNVCIMNNMKGIKGEHYTRSVMAEDLISLIQTLLLIVASHNSASHGSQIE